MVEVVAAHQYTSTRTPPPSTRALNHLSHFIPSTHPPTHTTPHHRPPPPAPPAAACHTGGQNSVQVEKTLEKAALEQYLDGGFNVDAIITQVKAGRGRGL